MKVKFAYTGIRVKHLEASVKFYTNVLGMKEMERFLAAVHERDRRDPRYGGRRASAGAKSLPEGEQLPKTTER